MIMNPYTLPGIYTNIEPIRLFEQMCEQLGFTTDEVKQNCRRHKIVMAKAAIARALKSRYKDDITTLEIGEFLNRDHSTISHYYNTIKDSDLLDEYMAKLKYHSL